MDPFDPNGLGKLDLAWEVGGHCFPFDDKIVAEDRLEVENCRNHRHCRGSFLLDCSLAPGLGSVNGRARRRR